MTEKNIKKLLIFCVSALTFSFLFLACESFKELNKNKVYVNSVWEYKVKTNIFSSPALDDKENIYFGTKGEGVKSLDKNGKLRWSFEPQKDLFYDSSPVLGQDNTLYIGSSEGYLYAINRDDGTEKWSFLTSNKIFSSAALDQDGTIYVGSQDQKLYAINPDGNMKWFFNTEGKIISSPLIAQDGTIYQGSNDGYVYAIDREGQLKWKYNAGSKIYSGMALNNEGTLLYVLAKNGELFALDTVNARLVWIYKIQNTDKSVSSFAGIIKGADDSLYITNSIGFVIKISSEGQEVWEYIATGSIYGTPAISDSGILYIPSVRTESEEGFLSIVNSDGKLLWQKKFSRDLRASPVIMNNGNVVFSSNIGRLYVIQGEGSGPASYPSSMFLGNRKHTGSYQNSANMAIMDSSHTESEAR